MSVVEALLRSYTIEPCKHISLVVVQFLQHHGRPFSRFYHYKTNRSLAIVPMGGMWSSSILLPKSSGR